MLHSYSALTVSSRCVPARSDSWELILSSLRECKTVHATWNLSGTTFVTTKLCRTFDIFPELWPEDWKVQTSYKFPFWLINLSYGCFNGTCTGWTVMSVGWFILHLCIGCPIHKCRMNLSLSQVLGVEKRAVNKAENCPHLVEEGRQKKKKAIKQLVTWVWELLLRRKKMNYDWSCRLPVWGRQVGKAVQF